MSSANVWLGHSYARAEQYSRFWVIVQKLSASRVTTTLPVLASEWASDLQ